MSRAVENSTETNYSNKDFRKQKTPEESPESLVCPQGKAVLGVNNRSLRCQ